MSFSNLINHEREITPDEIIGALNKAIDLVQTDDDASVIVMSATPAENPDYSEIDLYIHGPNRALVGEMIAMLSEWRSESIPKSGPKN